MIPPTSFELNDPLKTHIPSRGLGCFQVDPKDYPEGSVKDSVKHALAAGYRHFDTALAYDWGKVEKAVGEAIRESSVPREECFIVTKLHNVHHKPEDVEVGIDTSLSFLGMDYVDLYLMHFPYAYTKAGEDYSILRGPDEKPVIDIELSRAFDKTWAAMEALVDKGKARMIGVSNFSTPKLKRLLSVARIFPVVNQVELHPHFPQRGLVKFCQDNKIHIIAYGPLGCTPIPSLVGRTGPGPLDDATIASVAKKYNKTPAQLILCFMLLRGVSVIPKSNNANRIVQNFDCVFELSESDFETIDTLLGSKSEPGIRNLETRSYLGFDNFNEEREEP